MATASVRRSGFAGCCGRSARTPRSSFAATFPPAYRSLPGADEIRDVETIDGKYDAVFVIECSDLERPGINGLDDAIHRQHRPPRDQRAFRHDQLDRFDRVGRRRDDLQPLQGDRRPRSRSEIAECVYMALVTDTGSFHFSNTTDRTFKVASELIKAGAKPARRSPRRFTTTIRGRGSN